MSSGGPRSQQVRPPGAVRFGLTPRFDSFQHRRAVRLANRSNANDIDKRSSTCARPPVHTARAVILRQHARHTILESTFPCPLYDPRLTRSIICNFFMARVYREHFNLSFSYISRSVWIRRYKVDTFGSSLQRVGAVGQAIR